MKRLSSGMGLTIALILILNIALPAHGGMMGQKPMGQSEEAIESSSGGMMGRSGQSGMGMMGPQMMRGMMGGGMQGMPEGMGMPRPSQLVRMLKAELGLSDEQGKRLTQIFSQATKARIKQHADLRIAELELGELLEADPVDMGQVEGKLKAIEGLRTTLRLSLIKAHEQAKGLLTPEQRQQLERLHDRLPGMMGSGMMSMTEMMGEGGTGGMGMMGPQTMQQMIGSMMGGGMGGQPQGPVQTAGSPQNLTQEDKQGSVTVTATLLTPDKPRTDGKLAVQVQREEEHWRFQAQVYLGEVEPAWVRVELYADPWEGQDGVCALMGQGEPLPGAVHGYLYGGSVPATRPADHFTPRIIPMHPAARVPLEASQILWLR